MTLTVSQGLEKASCSGWQQSTGSFGPGDLWEVHSGRRDWQSNLANRDSQLQRPALSEPSQEKISGDKIQESSVQSELLSAPSLGLFSQCSPGCSLVPSWVLSSAQDKEGGRLCSSWSLPAGVTLGPVKQPACQSSVN